MIRTRYGDLSSLLLVAVELCVTGIVLESVDALDEGHRTLATYLRGRRAGGFSIRSSLESPPRTAIVRGEVGAGKTHAVNIFPETVADRWAAMRAELFAVSEVETTPVPDPAVVATMLDDGDARRVSEAIFAAVGVFLVSEANALDELIPFDDDGSFDDLETTVARVVGQTRYLRRHVKDGTWPQLYTAEPQAALPPESSTTGSEAASPEASNESCVDADSSPSTAMHHHQHHEPGRYLRQAVDLAGIDVSRYIESDHLDPEHSDRVLRIFQKVSCGVPAYREFLSLHGLTIDRVQTLNDFTKVPPTTHEDLVSWGCVDATVWSASKGSALSYWPRSEAASAANIDFYDHILRLCQSHRRRTLVVGGSTIGGWLGSTCTTQTLRGLEGLGLKLSVAAPGIDPAAVAREIGARGHNFEQIVLAGQLPFVEEVLRHADRSALSQNLQILLTGQSITEAWRDRIVSMVETRGGHANPVLLYGTADSGVLGHETPSTIAIRRLARDNLVLAEALFGGHTAGLPTLVEYDPQRVYAELDTDRLLVTTDSPVSLVRYQINDHARILDSGQLTATLHEHGYTIPVLTTTPGAGFLVIDGHDANDAASTPPTPKTARIRLVGNDADAELHDLMSWLYHQEEFRGRVKVEAEIDKRTERVITASQVLTVVLATGITGVAGASVAVLATALSLWLDRRRPRVTIEITRTDGQSTTIHEGDLPAAEETRQLLEPANG